MNHLEKFYEDAKKDESMNKELLNVYDEVKDIADEKEVMDRIIKLANKYGYEVTESDYMEQESALDLNELNSVTGGVLSAKPSEYILRKPAHRVLYR